MTNDELYNELIQKEFIMFMSIALGIEKETEEMLYGK